MSQKPDIRGMGHKWHMTGIRFELENFQTVLLITLGCYLSPLRNIGLYILMAVYSIPIDKCNKLWQHQHGIVGGLQVTLLPTVDKNAYTYFNFFRRIPRVCFSCNNFCFLPTCHSNCVTFDSVCPTSCSLCCSVCSCCIIYPIIIFTDTRCFCCRSRFLYIHISLLVGFFSELAGWLAIFNWLVFYPLPSSCCASLQILLRPINLMLSIFVKIYCLLLSEFDIVMQFVSHFWEVVMH